MRRGRGESLKVTSETWRVIKQLGGRLNTPSSLSSRSSSLFRDAIPVRTTSPPPLSRGTLINDKIFETAITYLLGAFCPLKLGEKPATGVIV